MDEDRKRVVPDEDPLTTRPVSRRQFLKLAGLAGAAIGLGAGLGGVVAACGDEETTTTTAAAATTTTAAAAQKMVLGYSAPFLFSDFETAQQDATMAAAKAAGWETLPATNADGDSAKQNSDIRNLISAGATGLIVVANDSKAVIPALDYAKEQGVPVVAIDIGPDGGTVAMIVRANNVGMGEIAADAMAKSIGETGKVLSLMGAQTSINGRDRSDGFREGIAKYPNIELIEEPTDWDATKQAAAVQTTLTANPDLKGIFQQADYALFGHQCRDPADGLYGESRRAWAHLQHQHRCDGGGTGADPRGDHGRLDLATARHLRSTRHGLSHDGDQGRNPAGCRSDRPQQRDRDLQR